MKCNCKSAPDYHREDCQLFDIYGNFKKKEKAFFYPVSDLLKINKEIVFVSQGVITNCNFSSNNSFIEVMDSFDRDNILRLLLDENVKQKYMKMKFEKDILSFYFKGQIKINKNSGKYEFHLLEPYRNRIDLMSKEY